MLISRAEIRVKGKRSITKKKNMVKAIAVNEIDYKDESQLDELSVEYEYDEEFDQMEYREMENGVFTGVMDAVMEGGDPIQEDELLLSSNIYSVNTQ